MDNVRRVRVLVSGRVQGVFFRGTTAETARELGLTGSVKNLPNGQVEAEFQGAPSAVDKAIAYCRDGPPAASVTGVEVTELDPRPDEHHFAAGGGTPRAGWSARGGDGSRRRGTGARDPRRSSHQPPMRWPTNPDKLLWPEAGVTKADLAEYYATVSDRLLPTLAGRPLTLQRFPDGVRAGGFFQKNLGRDAPATLPRHEAYAYSSRRTVTYPLAATRADLQWFAQIAATSIHPWLARTDRPERPDTLVLDLDPSGEQVPARAAHRVAAVLTEVGLAARAKTSGKRGLHLLVPLERRYGHPEVRGLALAVARLCAARHPDDLTAAMATDERSGRLLVDWSRNGPGQHLVAAWSPRATSQATVAVPLSWDEVTTDLAPAAFTLEVAARRPDPWADDGLRPQRLEGPARALAERGYPPEDADPRSTEGRIQGQAGGKTGGGPG